MREINVNIITQTVERLCIESNLKLPADIEKAIRDASKNEESALSCDVMQTICDNMDAAAEMNLPVCQDTGMAVVFLSIGQDVHFTDGNLYDAVNEGVRKGYLNGYLRLSVVEDPLRRKNTGDNTPAVIHTEIVPGDRVRVIVAPKGFGSENMSALKMFTPSATRDDILTFITDTVKKASSNPCPPIIVGVGIGGTFEKCAVLAKQALITPLDCPNSDSFYAEMEKDALSAINETGIGPAGLGGKTTALGVRIKAFPTHIAGLPVAVNIGCYVSRHKEETI
ncbi:MAG: fumarate hydratase [Bacillota bacterium]|nr:fumarate hydratase [Bacillota bacterium]